MANDFTTGPKPNLTPIADVRAPDVTARSDANLIKTIAQAGQLVIGAGRQIDNIAFNNDMEEIVPNESDITAWDTLFKPGELSTEEELNRARQQIVEDEDLSKTKMGQLTQQFRSGKIDSVEYRAKVDELFAETTLNNPGRERQVRQMFNKFLGSNRIAATMRPTFEQDAMQKGQMKLITAAAARNMTVPQYLEREQYKEDLQLQTQRIRIEANNRKLSGNQAVAAAQAVTANTMSSFNDAIDILLKQSGGALTDKDVQALRRALVTEMTQNRASLMDAYSKNAREFGGARYDAETLQQIDKTITSQLEFGLKMIEGNKQLELTKRSVDLVNANADLYAAEHMPKIYMAQQSIPQAVTPMLNYVENLRSDNLLGIALAKQDPIFGSFFSAPKGEAKAAMFQGITRLSGQFEDSPGVEGPPAGQQPDIVKGAQNLSLNTAEGRNSLNQGLKSEKSNEVMEELRASLREAPETAAAAIISPNVDQNNPKTLDTKNMIVEDIVSKVNREIMARNPKTANPNIGYELDIQPHEVTPQFINNRIVTGEERVKLREELQAAAKERGPERVRVEGADSTSSIDGWINSAYQILRSIKGSEALNDLRGLFGLPPLTEEKQTKEEPKTGLE